MQPFIANCVKDLLRSTSGRAASLSSGSPRRFVILANGRTGSNLLVSLLRQHKQIRVHAEIFGEHQLNDLRVRTSINRRSPVSYFKAAFRPLGFERAVGQKHLYYQLSESYGESRGIPRLHAVREALLADEDLYFLHLKRRNLLSSVISGRLAHMSKSWLGTAYDVQSVRLEPKETEEELIALRHAEETFDALLPPARTLDMHYEDIVENCQPQVKQIFAFLGLNSVDVQMANKKQTTKPHREYISNFDELTEYFEKTTHSRYFRPVN